MRTAQALNLFITVWKTWVSMPIHQTKAEMIYAIFVFVALINLACPNTQFAKKNFEDC
jgi:hypothetical protein